MRITKKQWVGIALVVVAAGVVWALMVNKQMGTDTDTGTGPTPTGAAGSPMAYTAAVKAYLGKRVQFDMYCQAQPTSLVFKNPVTIMLDNRSGDARVVKVGGTSYSLAGYGWKIVTVSSSTLPAKIAIDCGSARNVSYVSLQK